MQTGLQTKLARFDCVHLFMLCALHHPWYQRLCWCCLQRHPASNNISIEVSIQHAKFWAKITALPIEHRMLHKVPASKADHLSSWAAAHFPADKVHKVS